MARPKILTASAAPPTSWKLWLTASTDTPSSRPAYSRLEASSGPSRIGSSSPGPRGGLWSTCSGSRSYPIGLSLSDAGRPSGVFFRTAAGRTIPAVPRLLDLVCLLLTPTAERDDLAADVPEPDLVPPPDRRCSSTSGGSMPTRCWPWTRCPCRLSGLLADARGTDPALPRLVALRVVYAVSPKLGVTLRQGDDRILIAVDDGAVGGPGARLRRPARRHRLARPTGRRGQHWRIRPGAGSRRRVNTPLTWTLLES